MVRTIILIMQSAALGWVVSGLFACYLVATRSWRKAGNRLVIGFGYILFLTSLWGSLLLLIRVMARLDAARQFSPRDAAAYAYAASFACGVFLVLRAEIRWRKSVGLGDARLISRQEKKN